MRFKVKYYLLFIVILFSNSGNVLADDGYVYYESGSTNALVLGKNDDISMVYEKVDIFPSPEWNFLFPRRIGVCTLFRS